MAPSLPHPADNASQFAQEHNPNATPGLIYGGDEDDNFPDMNVVSIRHINKLIFRK